VGQAVDLQILMGVEDRLALIVTNLPLTELLTDEMDGIIGRPMDIHILDGKRILMSWASRFFCLVKVTFFLTHDGMKKMIKFAFAGNL